MVIALSFENKCFFNRKSFRFLMFFFRQHWRRTNKTIIIRYTLYKYTFKFVHTDNKLYLPLNNFICSNIFVPFSIVHRSITTFWHDKKEPFDDQLAIFYRSMNGFRSRYNCTNGRKKYALTQNRTVIPFMKKMSVKNTRWLLRAKRIEFSFLRFLLQFCVFILSARLELVTNTRFWEKIYNFCCCEIVNNKRKSPRKRSRIMLYNDNSFY